MPESRPAAAVHNTHLTPHKSMLLHGLNALSNNMEMFLRPTAQFPARRHSGLLGFRRTAEAASRLAYSELVGLSGGTVNKYQWR